MPFKDDKFFLDGQTLTIQELNSIVDNNWKIDLTQQAWLKVKNSRQAIYQMMSDNTRIVYGINTGFGNFADKIIPFEQRIKLQNNLIRSHSVCVGKSLPANTVKRMMVLRINTLCKGRSGIQVQNLKRYVDACNANYFPMVPQKGTVGASGDLAPLAHLALGMMGEGLAWEQQSQTFTNASKIMQKLNLQPIKLRQKEGLALINGTQFMSSIISEVASVVENILDSAIIIYAFAAQIFGIQEQSLNNQVIEFYKNSQPSLGKILILLRSYLNLDLSQVYKTRLQNSNKKNKSSSILQAFQNLAALSESLDFCKKIINQEMNGATDNPLVYLKEDGFQQDKLVSAGNFHGQYVAKAADFISMGLFSIGRFSEARIQRYVNQRISNLPGFLIKAGGLNSGYMILQYTSAALLSQSKVLAKPASTDSISTSASQEDHVSMGGYAARKSRQMLQNISYILGIQLMCAIQSISIIGRKPSQKLQRIYQSCRKYIRQIKQDQYYGPDIEAAKNLVQKGLKNLL